MATLMFSELIWKNTPHHFYKNIYACPSVDSCSDNKFIEILNQYLILRSEATVCHEIQHSACFQNFYFIEREIL